MAKDFFGSLGETITKTARELSGRAEEVYETQRIRNRISGEKRQVEKAMADLGKIIYKRYKDGIPMDEEEKALCEQIDQRMEQIEKYKSEMDNVKGNRFCPSCGNPLGRNDAYCSMCGAACPVPEPEEEAGDTVDGTAEEVYEAEESETVETAETAEEEENQTVDVSDGNEDTENGSKVSLSKGETEEEAPEAEDSVPEEEKTE